jgi:formylglycine-generating enzyme required for sulfatase activity
MDSIQVFISYARQDQNAAREIYRRVSEKGYKPWMDEKDLLPGQNFKKVIERSLTNSDFVIVCLSSASVTKRSFFQREIKHALDKLQEFRPDDIFLIPARLDACELPEEVSDYHCVDLFEEGGWDKLFESLSEQSKKRGKLISPHITHVASNLGLLVYEFATVKLGHRGEEVERRRIKAWQYIEELGNGVTIEMAHLPGGTFLMGAPQDEEGCRESEYPQHSVTVPEFFFGKYQVTQAQWSAISEAEDLKVKRALNPDSHFRGDNRLPTERVSWEDAVEFCARLEKKTGRPYRLPSEAEWEYACRAGTVTPFHFGPTIIPKFVNYDGNYPYGGAPKGEFRQRTTPVGGFEVANEFGLYDMHGNVWEWCRDAWHDNYYDAPTDGSAWGGSKKQGRVLRGGSWIVNASGCRSAFRYRYNPNERVPYVGFRLAFSTVKVK